MIKMLVAIMALWLLAAPSVYDFKLNSIDGQPLDLSKYKGKHILIVNTASKCGFTKQYADLEKLYKQYQDKLVVIGFPANNFGGQEPGSNAEIKEFCSANFGVSFPMSEKVSVKGDDIHPLFQWLTHKDQNGVLDAEIKWNFTKFLVDGNGKLVAVFPSNVNPMSEDITKHLN